MSRRIEFTKTIIHGDHELKQEKLLDALKNYLYARRYFTAPVDVFKQHNRDIYYIMGGPIDMRAQWTDPHLDEDERKNLQVVGVDDIVSRLDVLPMWYDGK